MFRALSQFGSQSRLEVVLFIGVYLAVCGLQYLIILSVSLILIRRKVASNDLSKVFFQYSILALSTSFLGLVLFSLVTIPIGNLHLNIPQDFTDPKLWLANLPKIAAMLLGLVGVTAPIWVLLFIFPKSKSNQKWKEDYQ
jgi:hypothetical protein